MRHFSVNPQVGSPGATLTLLMVLGKRTQDAYDEPAPIMSFSPVPRRPQPAHPAAAVHHPVPGDRDPGWAISAVAFALFVLAGISDALRRPAGAVAESAAHVSASTWTPSPTSSCSSTLFLVLTHVGLVPQLCDRPGVQPRSRHPADLDVLFATNALRDFRPSLLGKLNTAGADRRRDRGAVSSRYGLGTLGRRSRVSWCAHRRAGAALGRPLRVDCLRAESSARNLAAVRLSSRLVFCADVVGAGSSSFRISSNSDESKTSPHNWHSTNSASSSRATTRTWGCLQVAGIWGRICGTEFALPRSRCQCDFTRFSVGKPWIVTAVDMPGNAVRLHLAARR